MTPDRGYILHRALPSVLGLVANLKKAHLRSYALGPPMAYNGTAVIVGAGASLATSGDLLREAQSDGALVFTTNTALPALGTMGIAPDVVLAREAIDVSAQMEHPARRVIVDLAAHPNVFAFADSWFVAGGLQWFDVAAKLGVRPLFGGTASLTACVELARQWGATRVILVGVTLAFDHDGESYAPGTGYAGLRATHRADGLIDLDGPGADAQRDVNGGMYPTTQQVRWVEGQGGPRVAQLLTWADQQTWLENFADRHPAIECIDASGGALKSGWDTGVYKFFGTAMEMPKAAPPPDTSRALADLRRQCDSTESVVRAVIEREVIPDVAGYLDGADVVEAAAAAELLLMKEAQRGDHAASIRGTCEALQSAARRVREALR